MTAQRQEKSTAMIFGFLAISLVAFVLIVVFSKPASVLAAICIFFAQAVFMLIWGTLGRAASLSTILFLTGRKKQFRNYIDSKLKAFEMGALGAKPIEQAEYSYQVGKRRKVYRVSDCLLWLVCIRYVPKEFSIIERNVGCPKLHDGTLDATSEADGLSNKSHETAMATNWKSQFVELTTLIRHDDTLNWQKFHYVLIVFGALLTAYVVNLSQPTGNPILCMGLGCIGVLLSWGADLTFQEGLRCLRSHRRKQSILEEEAPPYKASFLYNGSSFNQRDVLEASPIVIFVLSLFLVGVAFAKFILTL